VPLVIMTPKSLLRLPAARSAAADLSSGRFRPVLSDPRPPGRPARVILCQGKLFYELDAARRERELQDVSLVRLERCAPFPLDELGEVLDRFRGAELRWAQEEPANMGAGRYVLRSLGDGAGLEARMIARPASASPATGSLTVHRREQAELLEQALAP
jgi:2-oxoglutarate dehydrogenase E1 component